MSRYISEDTCTALHDAFAIELARIGADFDIHFSMSKIYSKSGTVQFRIDGVAVLEDGYDSTRRTQFASLAASYGLSPDDLGRTLVMSGTEYTVTGLNPKAKKNVVFIRRKSDQKEFITSVAVVRAKMI